ncbi:MAG: hypothetical protein WBW87_10260 [Candidatus Cybelea sp.]
MVVFTGAENYIHNCIIRQAPLGPQKIPTNCTGIEIRSASEPYVTNTHISDFDTGISLVGEGSNPIAGHFSNLGCQSNVTSVSVVPAASGGKIRQLFFDNCVFALTRDSHAVSPGVKIDTSGGPNSDVSDIHFSNCIWYDWRGPAIAINAGQDIIINGCRIGSCALGSTDTGGLAITGTAANITVCATDCSGTVPGGKGQQPYAISVTAAVAGLYVRSSNLSGNAVGALYVNAASGTQIVITDCPGYNDRNTRLNGGLAPTAPLSAAECSSPYFGPSLMSFAHSTELKVHISGKGFMMKFGTLYLARPLDRVYFEPAAPSDFAWFGK